MAGPNQAAKKAETATKYFVCSRCSYHWKPRKPDSTPRNCPSCRSTVWMKPFEMKRCARCGYEWGSTSTDPRRCPGCGTYHWNESPQSYECMRCEHTWTAKRAWPPKRCPKCRAVSWNSEKKETPAVTEPEVKRPISSVMDEATVSSILEEYKKGLSCTQIAVKTGIPFSAVFQVVRESAAGGLLKV